jgi:isoquinoline 1-oxidoreductase beta subunit
MSLSRRRFLQIGLLASGALFVGCPEPSSGTVMTHPLNAWIAVPPEGPVTLRMFSTEVGQGAHTILAMLLSEELEVALSQVRVEAAPCDVAHFIDGTMMTGGSNTVFDCFTPMRQAGATARMMLVAAAAARWGVASDRCEPRDGHVVNLDSGARIPYGMLSADAARRTPPPTPALKPEGAWRLLGHSQARVEACDKITGRAAYGIDFHLPGLKIASIRHCPVLGGRLKSMDVAQASTVAGVERIVLLPPDAVAVVADTFWAAEKGAAALDLQWDDGPYATYNDAALDRALAEALERAGRDVQGPGFSPREDVAPGPNAFIATYRVPSLKRDALVLPQRPGSHHRNQHRQASPPTPRPSKPGTSSTAARTRNTCDARSSRASPAAGA